MDKNLYQTLHGEKPPTKVPAATAHSVLDQALNSTLNPVPPVSCFPFLLGLDVDQRMSSFISLTTAEKSSTLALL